MWSILFGIFIVLHGIVHLLYAGHSARLYEMQPGMMWPDNSWIVARLVGNDITRMLSIVLLILAGAGFMGSGAGLLLKFTWWRPVVIVACALSSFLYLVFWDGGLKRLDNQGIFGILINIAILVVILVIKWPESL